MGKTAAQTWREEGLRQGALETRQQTLIRQLRLKFKKKVTPAVVAAIEATQDTDRLDVWLDQIVNAQTLTEVGIPTA